MSDLGKVLDDLDAARARLARVTLTHRLLSSSPGEIECACGWLGPYLSQHQAEKLLPVVQAVATERAAAELLEMADAIPCSDSEIEAKQLLRDRADALTAGSDHPRSGRFCRTCADAATS